jgi:uncharacterized damage-inducible protein DinB
VKAHFVAMADYNAWANARVYALAAQLTDEQYRRDVGVFFRSLHGTLNHLLVADRIWNRRLIGSGEHPDKLNAIVCDDLPSLTTARNAEDQRIIDFVRGLSDAQLQAVWHYQTLNGTPQQQPRYEVLAHVFNHQTHHRGQVHAVLTLLGIAEPTSWDLLLMQRERMVQHG